MQQLVALRDRIRSSWWGLILSEHDTEPTEMSGGLLKLGLAVVLLTPRDTFGSSVVYSLLSVVPEPIWGVVLLVFGCLHLGSLHNGARSWRRAMAGVGFLIWFCWWVSFALGSTASTGSVVYLLAAFGQGWCYVRLGRAPMGVRAP